jgi:two-component system sensor histidine kinase PilS (NtrC family)
VRTKEKLAAVGEMAAQLAHEIRNPLGSIRGSAQVLSAEPALGEEQGRLLAIISRESKRLSDTLNRFLYQARAPVRPRHPVDLLPVIESAVTLLRNGNEVGPDHVVSFEADEGPHVCIADPDQIAQVFWNLVRNGLEAMPGGGRLEVALRRVGGEVVLTIRDEGHGLAGDEQRRLFGSMRPSGRPGAGLGLAIVFQIVRQHGGDISVQSANGQGTRFDVRLPLVSVTVPA